MVESEHPEPHTEDKRLNPRGPGRPKGFSPLAESGALANLERVKDQPPGVRAIMLGLAVPSWELHFAAMRGFVPDERVFEPRQWTPDELELARKYLEKLMEEREARQAEAEARQRALSQRQVGEDDAAFYGRLARESQALSDKQIADAEAGRRWPAGVHPPAPLHVAYAEALLRFLPRSRQRWVKSDRGTLVLRADEVHADITELRRQLTNGRTAIAWWKRKHPPADQVVD